MYKICAVIFCQADSNAFDKTLSSLENSSIFDETYFLFVFNDLYKQSSKHGKPIFEKEDMPRSNMKYLFTFTESFIEELERAITESGCDIVAPIFEGDTIDPYYLEYICYFFDENKDECKVVFATVVKPEQPEETDFGELPCGGVAAFDKDRNMPLTDRGFAFISGSFIEALTAGSGAWFFPEAVYKIIMTTGYYGMLATVKYYAEKNVEFPTFVLERLAENSIELYGELPFFLRNTIEKRLDEALLAPVIGSAPDVLSLYKYILEQFMDSRITPSVELISVQNYFEDMEIKGLYHYSRDIDPKEDFTLDTEAEYYDFIIRPVENTNADKLWPKAEFSAKLKLADNSVRVTFNQNGQPVSEIITPESGRNGNYEISRVGDDICFNKIAPRSFYKVSVIIPIYNGSDFLKEAIDSLKAQTLDFFVNIQIILVNDGSDDSTLEICREYVKKYPYNVCYIEQDRQGVSAARNSGLRLAMGKYTAFLDADDKLPPQFLETGVKFFEKQGAEVDVAAFPIQYFNQGEDTKQTASANYRFDKTRIVDINKDFDYVQFSACSAVFRTSALAGLSFDTRLSYCEDAEFTHKVLLNKMKYGVIKEPAYLYRTGGAATGGKRPVAAWKTRKGLLGKFLVDYALAQRGEVSEYTQYLIIHELQDNLSDQFYDGDDDTETEEILNVISETLTYVDDGLIKSAKRLNYWFRYYLLKLKHGLLELRNIDGKYGFYFGETLFENLEPRLNICSIAERDSILWIWGSFSLPMYDGIKFTADFNGE
ncbi:MAG: glycosyltransferase family 2 protein, partial [Clostridiales bacterium]|nr:glycosyltransferase family 2 protein [Clostridiales bacterium]